MKRLLITLFILSFAPQSWGGGTILTGDIHIKGARPKRTAPAIVEYHGQCGTKRSTSVVRLWKTRVMDTTLWLTKPDEGDDKTSSKEAVPPFDIIGWRCDFQPKLALVKPGTSVRIENRDPTVQWLIVEEEGEIKRQIMQEPGSKPVEMTIRDGRGIHLGSGFYPWMEGWIKPVKGLVAAVETEWDGRFFFKDIPSGRYILHSWHPSLGESSQEITVKDGTKTRVKILLELPEKKIPIIKASKLEKLLGTDGERKEENPFK